MVVGDMEAQAEEVEETQDGGAGDRGGRSAQACGSAPIDSQPVSATCGAGPGYGR